MDLEKAAYIVEEEFNKIAEDLSKAEVKEIIRNNRSEYNKFRTGAKLNLGDRAKRVFTTKEGFKNALGDYAYGTAAGLGTKLLTGNEAAAGLVAWAPPIYRSNKRRTARANKELEKRYGNHADEASKKRDIKRAFAQSLRNKEID